MVLVLRARLVLQQDILVLSGRILALVNQATPGSFHFWQAIVTILAVFMWNHSLVMVFLVPNINSREQVPPPPPVRLPGAQELDLLKMVLMQVFGIRA